MENLHSEDLAKRCRSRNVFLVRWKMGILFRYPKQQHRVSFSCSVGLIGFKIENRTISIVVSSTSIHLSIRYKIQKRKHGGIELVDAF